MKLLTKTAATDATEIYLVANTPSFILRRLKQRQYCIRLAREKSQTELLAELLDILEVAPQTTEELAYPFVLCAALAIKNDMKTLRVLSRLDTSNYRWLKQVVEAAISSVVPTTSFSIQSKPMQDRRNFSASNARNTSLVWNFGT